MKCPECGSLEVLTAIWPECEQGDWSCDDCGNVWPDEWAAKRTAIVSECDATDFQYGYRSIYSADSGCYIKIRVC